MIISDLEFPSNVLPWLRLRRSGVEVVIITGHGGALCAEDIIARITSRTRLISLSLVSYKTGAYLPNVEKIAAEAREVGAVLAIDATQALGRLPISLDGVDYLISSSFKWLLGPHGLGLVYVSPEFRKRFSPAGVGWYSVKDLFSRDRFRGYELKDGAACLAVGMPNFPSIYGLRHALDFLLKMGVEKIANDLKPVVVRLREGLCELGVQLLTPQGPECASGIVAFEHPKATQVGEALERQSVTVWAGDGRVRASVHLYNDMSDVDCYLQALRSILTA